MAKTQLVTKESLQALLDNASPEKKIHIIGKALTVLYNHQTDSERNHNSTDEDNGVGFAGCDAHGGTLTAKSYLRNHTLVQWQVDQWTRKSKNGFARICKYAGQLNDAAIHKQSLKQLSLSVS